MVGMARQRRAVHQPKDRGGSRPGDGSWPATSSAISRTLVRSRTECADPAGCATTARQKTQMTLQQFWLGECSGLEVASPASPSTIWWCPSRQVWGAACVTGALTTRATARSAASSLHANALWVNLRIVDPPSSHHATPKIVHLDLYQCSGAVLVGGVAAWQIVCLDADASNVGRSRMNKSACTVASFRPLGHTYVRLWRTGDVTRRRPMSAFRQARRQPL